MPNYPLLTERLKRAGFDVSFFSTAAEAADYLNREIDGKSVGMGGSLTLQEMGLYPRLVIHNEVHWHWSEEGAAARFPAMTAEVYLSSVNGLAESGEIVNIDGTGNRISALSFGHHTVYLIVGKNKIAPDYDGALWRAQNIAAPKNAQRLGKDTPCAVNGDQCYHCSSPDRICNALSVLWRKPSGIAKMELVLVDETLGY